MYEDNHLESYYEDMYHNGEEFDDYDFEDEEDYSDFEDEDLESDISLETGDLCMCDFCTGAVKLGESFGEYDYSDTLTN